MPPSVSKAQFGMMGLLFRRGKITREELERFNKGLSGRRYKRLPDHVKSAAKARAATRAAAARRVAEILRRKRRKR